MPVHEWACINCLIGIDTHVVGHVSHVSAGSSFEASLVLCGRRCEQRYFFILFFAHMSRNTSPAALPTLVWWREAPCSPCSRSARAAFSASRCEGIRFEARRYSRSSGHLPGRYSLRNLYERVERGRLTQGPSRSRWLGLRRSWATSRRARCGGGAQQHGHHARALHLRAREAARTR